MAEFRRLPPETVRKIQTEHMPVSAPPAVITDVSKELIKACMRIELKKNDGQKTPQLKVAKHGGVALTRKEKEKMRLRQMKQAPVALGSHWKGKVFTEPRLIGPEQQQRIGAMVDQMMWHNRMLVVGKMLKSHPADLMQVLDDCTETDCARRGEPHLSYCLYDAILTTHKRLPGWAERVISILMEEWENPYLRDPNIPAGTDLNLRSTVSVNPRILDAVAPHFKDIREEDIEALDISEGLRNTLRGSFLNCKARSDEGREVLLTSNPDIAPFRPIQEVDLRDLFGSNGQFDAFVQMPDTAYTTRPVISHELEEPPTIIGADMKAIAHETSKNTFDTAVGNVTEGDSGNNGASGLSTEHQEIVFDSISAESGIQAQNCYTMGINRIRTTLEGLKERFHIPGNPSEATLEAIHTGAHAIDPLSGNLVCIEDYLDCVIDEMPETWKMLSDSELLSGTEMPHLFRHDEESRLYRRNLFKAAEEAAIQIFERLLEQDVRFYPRPFADTNNPQVSPEDIQHIHQYFWYTAAMRGAIIGSAQIYTAVRRQEPMTRFRDYMSQYLGASVQQALLLRYLFHNHGFWRKYRDIDMDDGEQVEAAANQALDSLDAVLTTLEPMIKPYGNFTKAVDKNTLLRDISNPLFNAHHLYVEGLMSDKTASPQRLHDNALEKVDSGKIRCTTFTEASEDEFVVGLSHHLPSILGSAGHDRKLWVPENEEEALKPNRQHPGLTVIGTSTRMLYEGGAPCVTNQCGIPIEQIFDRENPITSMANLQAEEFHAMVDLVSTLDDAKSPLAFVAREIEERSTDPLDIVLYADPKRIRTGIILPDGMFEKEDLWKAGLAVQPYTTFIRGRNGVAGKVHEWIRFPYQNQQIAYFSTDVPEIEKEEEEDLTVEELLAKQEAKKVELAAAQKATVREYLLRKYNNGPLVPMEDLMELAKLGNAELDRQTGHHSVAGGESGRDQPFHSAAIKGGHQLDRNKVLAALERIGAIPAVATWIEAQQNSINENGTESVESKA